VRQLYRRNGEGVTPPLPSTHAEASKVNDLHSNLIASAFRLKGNPMQFKHHQARRQVVFGGMAIMLAITMLSCVSSFMIYRSGFSDMPYVFQNILAGFAVVVVEGTFIWLVFGISKAFSSALERLLAFLGLIFIVGVMLLNLVSHFQIAKGIPLSPFQQEWVSWAAVCVFVGVLLLILAITLSDPIARLIRLEIRYWGKQQETIISAKTDALESERIQTAMSTRADNEAERLAQVIEGEVTFPSQLDSGSSHRSGHRERLEIPAQKKETAKKHASFNPEGLRGLREALKDISFRLHGFSFKVTPKDDCVWIVMVKANRGTQETVSSMRAKLSILDDVLRMDEDEFRERLERMLVQNGFEI